MSELSNADFRKLLAEGKIGEEAQKKKEIAKQKAKKKAINFREKQRAVAQSVTGGEGEEDGETYRDRAAERRKGITGEHEDPERALEGIYIGDDTNLTEVSPGNKLLSSCIITSPD